MLNLQDSLYGYLIYFNKRFSYLVKKTQKFIKTFDCVGAFVFILLLKRYRQF